MRSPGVILPEAARTLDFTRPTALMLTGILGLVEDFAQAGSIVSTLLAALPSGSYLALRRRRCQPRLLRGRSRAQALTGGLRSGTRSGVGFRVSGFGSPVLEFGIHPAFPVLFRGTHDGSHLGERTGVRQVGLDGTLVAGVGWVRHLVSHAQHATGSYCYVTRAASPGARTAGTDRRRGTG